MAIKYINNIMIYIIMLLCSAEKITYISVERPVVTYSNSKYIESVVTTARRISRVDPIYYYNLNVTTKLWASNNFSADFYFYEFLTNQYKPSFVEMHFKLCDLIHKDNFFGAAMKQGKVDRPCPYPPDTYELYNMTIPPTAIPRGFPFTKGRIYCNMTFIPKKELVASGQVDMELRQMTKPL